VTAADPLRLAVAAYLARFSGSSRDHAHSDLRCFLAWCAQRGLDPLTARRVHLELYIRWMQEVRRFKPSTVSRRFSVAAGFYRTAVIDGVLEHSPAEHVRRPAVPPESPTLGFTHPWTQVKSPNPSCPHFYGSYNDLYGVSARSGSDAWAVGDYGDCATALFKRATLVAHWNGRVWVNALAIPTSTRVSSSRNPVASGRATCRVTYASAGSHAIKAHYSGYADYARSTSPTLTETVKTPATNSVPVSPR